jgi:hypothetical protein
LKVAVIACEIFKHELESILENDSDVIYKEYLEYALHNEPEKLKNTVCEKVNSLQGKVDSVFLAYAVCQILKGVTGELKVPTVMLDAEDCIGVLLTQMEYTEEKQKCPGTWFNSPGWAEMGIEGAIKDNHCDCMTESGFSAIELLSMIFDGYERCLYIDTGVGDRSKLTTLSLEFADVLKLRHECREGRLDMLRKGLEEAKMLAVDRPT